MLLTEHIFQIFALISGLIAWNHIRPAYLRVIVFILTLTVLNESIIEPYIDKTRITSNDLGYNIFSFFDMAVWLYIFYRILDSIKIKKFVSVATIIVFGYTVIELFFKTTWYKLHVFSFMVYELVIIIAGCIYLYSILKKTYHPVMNDPLFWVSTACITYHCLMFLNLSTLQFDSYWNASSAYVVYDIVQVSANVFYYLLLSTAFFSCIYYNRQLQKPRSPIW